MLAAGGDTKALNAISEASVAELENSKEKEMKQEKTTLRKKLILGDRGKEEHVFHSQPGHCQKKLVSIQIRRYIPWACV